MKEQFHFKQLQLNYINNHQKKKRAQKLVTVSIELDMVAKLSNFIVIFHLLSFVPKKVELLKITNVMELLWKSLDKKKSQINSR